MHATPQYTLAPSIFPWNLLKILVLTYILIVMSLIIFPLTGNRGIILSAATSGI